MKYYEIFCICALVYMVTRTIIQEKIFEWVKDFFLEENLFFLHELFSCFFCLSFWVSCSCFFLGVSFIEIFLIWMVANFLHEKVMK